MGIDILDHLFYISDNHYGHSYSSVSIIQKGTYYHRYWLALNIDSNTYLVPMNKIAILSLLVIPTLVLSGCTQPAASPPAPVTQEQPSSTPETTAIAPDGEVQVINLEAGSFYYKPDSLKFKKGQKVRLVISSVSMMHDFNIDELNVRSPIIKSGDTGTVEFVASQVGTFQYYCSVGQHRQNGQMGTLTIEE